MRRRTPGKRRDARPVRLLQQRCGLAAAYGHGLAKNHAFVDGNKRVAFLAADSFLRVNGFVLTLDPDKWEGIMLGVADGSVSAEALAAHFAEEMGGAVPLEV